MLPWVISVLHGTYFVIVVVTGLVMVDVTTLVVVGLTCVVVWL